jgi:hypothetical protein
MSCCIRCGDETIAFVIGFLIGIFASKAFAAMGIFSAMHTPAELT